MNRILMASASLYVISVAAACSAAGAPSEVVSAVGDTFVEANLQRSGTAGPANVGGTVRLLDLPATDNSHIQVAATGLPPGPHAWHIHTGTCAQAGGVVLAFTTAGQNQGIDNPIVAGADGRGAEDADIPANRMTQQQLTGSPHALHIHANVTPPGASIACADLR
jgi:Cu/Zn superoxide dismutase